MSNVLIKKELSATGEQEVRLEHGPAGGLMVFVKQIDAGLTGVWGANDNEDAEMRYELAVRTGSFIRDRATILAEIEAERHKN